MATVTGTWRLVIDTPIGKQYAVLELTQVNGALRGVATDEKHGDEVQLTDLALEGDVLTWAQAVRRPMRLNLIFEVTVTGELLAGHAKAGRLPSSKVSGHRTVRPQ
ncbi:hypothetical protein [Streptomyces sp. SID13031]|uniref:hypothetical protein n=1 Tax=Streptomyces sp. SID13031 TaxID=2706046 RepID=UPI0013C7B7C0|nr:hypothetical protein [Streptomyces sp. SID13031]NEA30767.1 hypothetical protein [Streptomyces sp. SID13031]